jgi:hypothetical protein
VSQTDDLLGPKRLKVGQAKQVEQRGSDEPQESRKAQGQRLTIDKEVAELRKRNRFVAALTGRKHGQNQESKDEKVKKTELIVSSSENGQQLAVQRKETSLSGTNKATQKETDLYNSFKDQQRSKIKEYVGPKGGVYKSLQGDVDHIFKGLVPLMHSHLADDQREDQKKGASDSDALMSHDQNGQDEKLKASQVRSDKGGQGTSISDPTVENKKGEPKTKAHPDSIARKQEFHSKEEDAKT